MLAFILACFLAGLGNFTQPAGFPDRRLREALIHVCLVGGSAGRVPRRLAMGGFPKLPGWLFYVAFPLGAPHLLPYSAFLICFPTLLS